MIGQAADSITKGYCYAVVVLCSALSFNTEKILIYPNITYTNVSNICLLNSRVMHNLIYKKKK